MSRLTDFLDLFQRHRIRVCVCVCVFSSTRQIEEPNLDI
jgi:hypothetical protein